MIGNRGNTTNSLTSPDALSAHFAHNNFDMSEDKTGKGSMKMHWGSKKGPGDKPSLFKPDELDIYCNKVTLDAYIFHGKTVAYETIDHLEYDAKHHTVNVFMKDGTHMDLGVKIQWLVRPYFSKAKEVNIVQTKDGQQVTSTIVPLLHTNK